MLNTRDGDFDAENYQTVVVQNIQYFVSKASYLIRNKEIQGAE
jgi:hypothetical protein